MKKIFFLLSIILFSTTTFSQDYSNKGKEFWIAYMAHINTTDSYMAIYITSDQDGKGTITGGGLNISFDIKAKKIDPIVIGKPANGPVKGNSNNVYLSTSDGIKTNAAIKVTTTVASVVYAHIIKSARSGATLVLPTPVLGTEYVVPCYPSDGQNGGANQEIPEFAIVATKPNTIFEFTPTVDGIGGKIAGTTYRDTLINAGDCYQFQGVAKGDISGTVVKSISTNTTGCKPIAVFAGSTWSAFGCSSASGGDNLYQQLFPYRSWGKKFVTAPFINRVTDLFRIYIKDTTTVVKITDNGITTTLGAANYDNTKKFYFYETGNPIYIDADKSISVAQFITSMSCKSGCEDIFNVGDQGCFADPEMVMLNPIEQTLKDIIFYSADKSAFSSFQAASQVDLHFVNIIIDKKYKASVKIDGAAPTGSFIDIPATNYSYLQEDLTNSTINITSVHSVIADTGFSAIVYGYGRVESYGYNGGTNVLDLYQYITLQNQFATVNFPATCKNTPFNFSITLPYKPIKLNWDFGNNPNLSPNATIVNTNPAFDSSFIKDGKTLYVYKLPGTYSFSQTGSYTIKVIVNNPTSDGCGGEQEIDYDVQVYEAPPKPSITIVSDGCINSPVTFIDNSLPSARPITKWFWNFGDGTKDSVKNPIKIYTTSGNFNINYKVVTDIGCVTDTTKPIALTPIPTAKFGVQDSICVNSLVTFFDSSNVVTPYTIAKWYWDYGNGKKDTFSVKTNPSTTYTTSGSYTVSLIVETSTGCKSILVKKDINIRPYPVVDFNLPGNVCLPIGAAIFINTSTISDNTQANFTYKWLFGNGDSSTQKDGVTNFVATGPFSVKLSVKSKYGCVAETIKTLNTVYLQPKANFNATQENCLRDTSKFTDISDGKGNNVVKWNWNFGDGITDINQNPQHIYTNADTFNVTLFVVTDKGCVSDTMLKKIIVNPLPVAGFTVSNPFCEKRFLTFTDTSKANVGNIVSWGWNMGNGTFLNYTTLPNPFTYKYDTTGTYNVKMMVVNSKGCKSDTSAITTITTKPLPHIGFTLPEVCLDDAFAQFNDTSTIADGTAFIYNWTFGDKNATASNPNFSTFPNPKHSYTDTGIYSVKLFITTTHFCTDSLIKSFTVNGSTPTANYNILNATNLCSNDSVKIKNTSTVDFGNVTKLEIYWDTANNISHYTLDDNPTPNKIYTTIYNKFSQPIDSFIYIKMISYSGISCKDSITKKITLRQAPKVNFAPIKSICKDATGRIITEATEIGGVAGNGVFTGVGIVNVSTGLFDPANVLADTSSIKYIFTSTNFGCIDSARQTIKILKSPIAKFGVSKPLCEKNDFTILDSSTTTIGVITTWNWDFGNSTTATKNNANPFTIKYNAANTYYITLKVTTDSGCQHSILQPIKINYLPKVNFIVPTICLPNGTGIFIDSTIVQDSASKPFSYVWHFGDKNDTTKSVIQNPSHHYIQEDTTKVVLIVTTQWGCVDSSLPKTLIIYPQPKAFFTSVPDSIICVDKDFNFYDKSNGISGAITQWNWTTSSSHIAAQHSKNATFNFDDRDTGSVTISLQIINSKNCPSNIYTKIVTIFPYPKVVLPTQLNFLQGGLLTINPISIKGNDLQFLWTVNNADIIDDTVLNAQVYPNDDKRFYLTTENIAGCRDTTSVYIVVLKQPIIPTAFSPNGDGINDTWEIEYLESYPGCTVRVFDRFGKIVLSPVVGYPKSWNGTLNGNPLPIGVYYYIIEPKNGRPTMTGTITILR